MSSPVVQVAMMRPWMRLSLTRSGGSLRLGRKVLNKLTKKVVVRVMAPKKSIKKAEMTVGLGSPLGSMGVVR